MSILTHFFEPICKQQWIVNSASNTCNECKNTIKAELFSSGKHHCRNCGNIVCVNCSEQRIVNNRICNTCYSRFEKTESYYQTVLLNWNTIRPSNIHNDFCELQNDIGCMSSDRLFFFINNYDLWLKQNDKFHLNPLQFITILSNYNIISLLDDYHHVMHFHCGKQEKCMFTDCVCLQRNMRDSEHFAGRIDETRQLFYISNNKNMSKVADFISIQQLLDTMHCFVSHKRNDEIHNNEKFITEVICTESKIDNNESKQQNNVACAYGFGVEINYWDESDPNYCCAKYNDLKSELLMNNVYKLQLFEYETIINQGKKYEKTKKCKKSKARSAGYRNKMCGMRRNNAMPLNHIVSVMLYCNNNVVQRIFKSTYRTTDAKHCEVCKWARYLYESIVFYGKSAAANDVYYHGINQLIMFDSFETQFFIPISTTIDVIIANRFSAKNGIIVEFGKTFNNTVRCLDVSCLSAFPQEKERLFVYGFIQFRNIWLRTVEMKNYILALKLFDKIIKGSYFAHNQVICSDKNQEMLVSLINQMIQNVDTSIPIYVISLLRFRCNKMKMIFLNKAELKSLNVNLNNLLYDSLIPYLFNDNDNIIRNDIYSMTWKIEGENLKLFWGIEKNKSNQVDGDKFVYVRDNNINITFIPVCCRDSDKNDAYFCFGFDIEYNSNLIKGCRYEYDIFIENNSFHTTAAVNCSYEAGVRIPYLFPSKVLSSMSCTQIITIRFCIRVIDVCFVNLDEKNTDTQAIHNIVDAYYGYGMHIK